MTNIQQRHDTAENWTTTNPVLLDGEIGFETDTNKFKFGNGINDYNSLPYAYTSGGGGLEIGDIGTALYIDETKGKRRWLNGSVMSINSNTQGFLNWLKKAVQSVPSIATTETNWQAEASLSVYGQCGKFVIDETAGTIRLPKVVNIQGLQDLTKAGAKVEAGLPGITHTHTRGSMNITGQIVALRDSGRVASNGCFSVGANIDTRYTYIDTALANDGYYINFNAANSWTGETSNNSAVNSIYGKSTTVQPEAVQYPYFIQIATGSETEVDVVNEIEFNNPYSLLEVKWSDKKINNLSWLISQGQANSGAVYVDVYNFLMSEYENGTNEYETINGTTINYRKSATTGIKITIDKASYDAILTATGTSWYYVLDGENQVFYLPQTNGFLQGGEGGKFTKAGLPNITGDYGVDGLSFGGNNITKTGAFSGTEGNNSGNGTINIAPTNGNTIFNFNASKSNSIYGNSNTVQPNSVSGYLYFYVGETVQNANLIDAGRISEQLAEKLDKSQKQEITGWGFPSTRYNSLTLGAPNSTYTAPAAGWFTLWTTAANQNGGWIHMYGRVQIFCGKCVGDQPAIMGTIPVQAGETISINYNNINTPTQFKFVYAEGVK